MRGIRFLVLLLIAIPLGWYAYHDAKKGAVDATPKKDKVFSVEADKIDELEIKSESGDRTTLRKKGNDWEIAQPVSGASDQSTVSSITSNLSSLEISRVIDENPGNLKEFGLASPRIEVAFKSGGQQHRLQIGDKTPTGSVLYAKLADGKLTRWTYSEVGGLNPESFVTATRMQFPAFDGRKIPAFLAKIKLEVRRQA